MKELEDAPEPKFVSGPREHSITPGGMRALQKKLKATKDDDERDARCKTSLMLPWSSGRRAIAASSRSAPP